MANKYWYGGTGNWSDATNHWSNNSGNSPASPTSAPSNTDNAIFDANSGTGTVTINTTATCLNLDFTNSTVLTMAGTSQFNVYGNLIVKAGMTISYSGIMNFRSTTTGKTITTNGVQLGCHLYFLGNGGGWTAQDNINMAGKYLQITYGTFDLNEKTLTLETFNSNNSNTRAFDISNSTLNMTGHWNLNTATNMTLTTTGSTINMGSGNFNGGGKSYNDVIMSAANTPIISGENTFANLSITGTSSFTYAKLIVQNNFTVSGTLTLAGNSVINRLWVLANTAGTAMTITAATVSIENVDFSDITGAGAGSWSGTSIGDALGNSGITFTTPVTRYWVGTTGGNWSDFANWDADSGGAGGDSVPLCHDTVIFDANSINTDDSVISVDMPRIGTDITFTGITNSPTLTIGNTFFGFIYGSLTLAAGMTVNGDSPLLYARSNKTITCAGATILEDIRINALGGKYTLQDDLVMGDGFYTPGLVINDGDFDANNFNLTIGYFAANVSDTPFTVTMGNGTWELNDSWGWFFYSGNTLYCNGSTIKMTGGMDGGNWPNFNGGGETYNKLWITGNDYDVDVEWQILGSNTFSEIKIDTGPKVIDFEGESTQTITTLTIDTTSGNEITLQSDWTGHQFILSKATGTVECSYIKLIDSNVGGGATWIAHNSADTSNNDGWKFDKYWYGGSGNWSDAANHWSGNSNNSPSLPTSAPVSLDDVFIDANSGFSSGGTITLNTAPIFHDLTCSSGHTFTISGAYYPAIYGSLILESGVTLNLEGAGIDTRSVDVDNVINFGGASVSGINNFNVLGTGGVTLQSDLIITGEFYQDRGIFDANDHNVTAGDFYFYIDVGYNPTIIMGSGTWEATNSNWDVEESGGEVFVVVPETSTIKMIDDSVFYGGDKVYNNLWIAKTGSFTFELYGSNTFNDLKIEAGVGILFGDSSTQTLSTFTALGSIGNIITMNSSDVNQFTLSKSIGTVTCDYLDISNSNVIGGATWLAGVHSADTINNDGWIFNKEIVVTAGEFLLAGIAGSIHKRIVAAANAFILTASNINFTIKMPAALSEFILTGVSTILDASKQIQVITASFISSGTAILNYMKLPLTTVLGEFTFTGYAATVIQTMIGRVKSYTFTGINALLEVSRKTSVSVGEFTLTGVSNSLYHMFAVLTTVGTFALTGISNIFAATRKLVVAVGEYELTSISSIFRLTKKIIAAASSFTLTMIAAAFTYKAIAFKMIGRITKWKAIGKISKFK